MINTILLSSNGCFVDENGNLPSRENIDYDKELLNAFCKNATVSQKSFNSVPPSMQKSLKIQKMYNDEITLALSIPEISELSDVLLVNRSSEILENGKKFRFDNFNMLTKQGNIEIWVKK